MENTAILSENRYRIIVVDSHPLVREGLRSSFGHDDRFEIVAECPDVQAAITAGQRHSHQIMIVGAVLSGANIFDALRSCKRALSNTRIAICYAPEDSIFLQEFIEAGADALLGQDATSSEYLAAALSIVTGGFYISSNLVECLLFDKKATQQRVSAYHLTPRETEILRMLSRGLCNKEIANILDISVRTVEAHRFSIRNKTNSNSLSDLVRLGWGLNSDDDTKPGGAGSLGKASGAESMDEYASLRTRGDRS
jgi:DNA-binding NarL/FixJ family response regulator